MTNLNFSKRVLFIGVPDMALIALDSLLYAGVNIVGVLGPKKTHNTYAMFRNFVKSRKLDFIEYDKLNESELLSKIRALNVDIAVVCSFNSKIPKEFIDLIKDGIINVHPSLLPNYRGGNPYSKVIENGESQTGVTLHFMSEEFDTGDIIAQERCGIDQYETMGTLFEKTNKIACKMLLKVLFYYEKNCSLPRQPQPEGEFIQANNYKDSELFIDFNKSAVEIERFVRALNPYINAMTTFKNSVIKLHKVAVDGTNYAGNFQNGEICKIENNKIFIKTSDGCIIPEVMQLAGYFIGNSDDFVRIAKPKIGDKFGNG